MKIKQTVILLSGKAGTGKSYYAKLIKDSISRKSKWITPFASPLKKALDTACYELYNCFVQDLSKEQKEQFRPVLQTYGQIGRAINENFWVNKVIEITKKQKYMGNEIFIIDDCRFPNELNAFGDYNTIKIRIKRDSVIKNVNPDSSETGLDAISDGKFDLVIDQKMSDAEVVAQVGNYIAMINKGLWASANK